ncbi:adenosine deaminase family protein [Novosphingobium terrae]|uniref:adenosine deaminase family protein n=1 Tax=Novosphingobium terrae TaxID=2726189 RepID=UPI0019824125|nr:adenosine deaminase [Novosphingobium terrae]
MILRLLSHTGVVAAALLIGAPLLAAPQQTLAAVREAQVSTIFDHAAASPTQLRVLLRAMPKGGDLHNHMGGSVYAEDFMRWAGEKGLCVNAATLAFTQPPCASGFSAKDVAEKQPFLFARMIDNLSTRGWQHGVGRNDTSGHTQFFDSFEKFGPAEMGKDAEGLVATRRIAALDHVLYIELQHNPGGSWAWGGAAPDEPITPADLPRIFAREKPAMEAVVSRSVAALDAQEQQVQAIMGCGTPKAEAGCGVAVHYLAQSARGMPPLGAFRTLMASFTLAARDPRYVGVNIVEPEDWPISLRDYDLHMAMFRFLEGQYPQVHRSLHAGELAFGLVPPTDLADHIAKAIRDGGAQRIGHGTDIALESDANATMARMARDGIAVEINLTSNAVILGVSGADHPLNLYRKRGVPVVLSTDDQGVLRTDMTNEYLRAIREQGLTYRDLKQISRNGLEFSFIPGASLWQARHVGMPVVACASGFDTAPCRSFTQGSEKARMQLALETQLAAFERTAIEENKSA